MKVNIERLEQQVRVLREAKEAELPFSLSCWAKTLKGVRKENRRLRVASGNPDHPCKTVCCAAGLAMQDPWHNEQGLHGGTMPVYKNQSGFGALKDYYGITWRKAEQIFSSVGYDPRDQGNPITIDMVIEKITQYVKQVKKDRARRA